MFKFLGLTRYLEQLIRNTLHQELATSVSNYQERHNLSRTIDDLKKQVADLEIIRDKKQEEFDRQTREIEHKIGLERKRQEFEIDQAKRETSVKVREENLAADKERFKSEMDFQRQHLQQEITSLRALVDNMLKRLPSVEILADITKESK